jgi:hypothetical protein
MKRLFTSAFVLSICFSHAQSFDHIVYKHEVNQAYELAINQGNYTGSLQKLETVKKNYRMLYGEDYRLQAYCYKMLGNDSLAALALKTCWSVPSFDMRTLWYVDQLQPTKLMKGFNEAEIAIVNEGFDNAAMIRPKNADSIIRVFTVKSEEDRLVRDALNADPENKVIQNQIDFLNREHESFLENYIRMYGYPGEKQLQFIDSEIWVILIHSSGNEEFYQRMKPVFLEEVRIGSMSPWMFANFVDQHQFYNNLPSVYQSLTNQRYVNTKEERKQISKNRNDIGLVDLEFKNPRFE